MAASNHDDHAARLEAIAREAYDRCHPDDSFDDMKRRAPFSKEDRCLLGDWLAFAQRKLHEDGSAGRLRQRKDHPLREP